MALIQCPECNGNVSDQAPTCPHCGFPLSNQTAAATATPPSATTDQPSPEISPEALTGYPGKPYHWSDRIPVAFLLFWGGMLMGAMMGSGDIVESLEGNGIQAAERTPVGWLAWAMIIGGVLWFVGKNVFSYLHYRNWKIDRLHQELIEEAEQAESAGSTPQVKS
jgi:hypothetical protein